MGPGFRRDDNYDGSRARDWRGLRRRIIAWFKLPGRGYQTRINAVLRAFVEAQKPHR